MRPRRVVEADAQGLMSNEVSREAIPRNSNCICARPARAVWTVPCAVVILVWRGLSSLDIRHVSVVCASCVADTRYRVLPRSRPFASAVRAAWPGRRYR